MLLSGVQIRNGTVVNNGFTQSKFTEALNTTGRMTSARILNNNTVVFNDTTINSINLYWEAGPFKSVMRVAEVELNGIYLINDVRYTDLQLGVSADVGVNFYYLSYGAFTVKECEQNLERKTTKLVMYDDMIKTMEKYDLNLTYPMTNYQFLTAIATRCGITLNQDVTNTRNMLLQRNTETYTDSYTYRDILDDFAEIQGTVYFISSDNQLHEGPRGYYPEPDLDETQLATIKIGDKFTTVSNVVFARVPQEDNVHYPATVGTGEIIRFENNQLVEGTLVEGVPDRTVYLQNAYNGVRASVINYYPVEIESYGYLIYEPGDMVFFNITDESGQVNEYKTYWYSTNIEFGQGIKEKMVCEVPVANETDFTKSTSESQIERNTYLYVDKVNGEIRSYIGEVDGRVSEVTQTVEGLTSTVSGMETTLDNSIKSYSYRYYKSNSPTQQPTDAQFDGSGGSDTMPAREDGKYIWRRTVRTKNDNTTTKVYEMIQGADGSAGVSIVSTQYQAGTSATTPPTGTWQDNPVSVPQGQYLWTKITYSDGRSTYSVARQGADGHDGTDGTDGTSVTVTSTTYAYAKSTSGTTPPTSGWGTTPVAPTANEYAWTRTTINYSVGDPSVIYTVGGKAGTNGTNGTNGANGKSLVSTVAYYALNNNSSSAPADGSFSTTVVTPTASNRYVWQYELLTWNDNGTTSTTRTSKHIVGVYGEDGNGISSIAYVYKVTPTQNAPRANEFSDSQTTIPAMSATNKYLWQRETITYSKSGVNPKVTVSLIAVYGDKGNDGKGISAVNYYYKVTTAQTPVPAYTTVTSTTIPTMSDTDKYLWQRTETIYTDSTSKNEVALIAIYGDTGLGIKYAENIWYLKDARMNISLQGNTEQAGSSGKNVFDNSDCASLLIYNGASKSFTDGVVTITKNANSGLGGAYIPSSVTSTKYANLLNNTWTISVDIKASVSTTGYVGFEGSSLRVQNVSVGTSWARYSATATPTRMGAFVFYARADTVTMDVRNIQVERGSTATAYEPHVSPNTPQPIQSVSGDNTVKIIGRNLLTSDMYVTSTQTYMGATSSGYVHHLEAGTYTITKSSNMSVGTYYREKNDSGNTQIMSGHTGVKSATFTLSGGDYRFWFYSSGGVPKNQINYFQLEKGSTATSYAPYVEKVYPLTLPVANLFDKNNANTLGCTINYTYQKLATSANAKTLYIPCLPNTTYTVSKILSARFIVATTANTPSANEPIMGYINNDTGTVITITTDSTSAYLCVYYFLNGTDTLTEEEILNTIQIERGSTANHYSPYGNPSIELNKIGTYQDYIYKNGDKWYVHKEINKLNLGTITTWTKSSSGNKYYTTITPLYKWAGNDVMLCDSYTFDGIGDGTRGYYGANGTFRYGYNATSSSSYSEIYFTNESISTLADFKTSVNGVLVYYPLQTTTDTEIIDGTLVSQLDAISRATSYAGQTNILQTNNDAPFNIEWNTTAVDPPAAPIGLVTTTLLGPEIWTLSIPTFIDGYRYYSCSQVIYDDDTFTHTEVLPQEGFTNNAQYAVNTRVIFDTELIQTKELIEQRATKEEVDYILNGDGGETILGLRNLESDYKQTADQIESLVKEVVYTKDMNGYLTGYEKSSDLTQDVESIMATFTQQTKANGEILNEYITAIELSRLGIIIGKSDSQIKSVFTNTALKFITGDPHDDDAQTLLAWIDANDGLGVAKISIGSPGEQRWRIFTRLGNHLTWSRH